MMLIPCKTSNLMLPKKIRLSEKLSVVKDYWHPRIVASLNGQLIKVARLKGTFIWHSHQGEDELFWVHSGRMAIDFRNGTVELDPGDMLVVPRGVEHRPRTISEEVELLLFEPASTLNTGEQRNERTRDELEWI